MRDWGRIHKALAPGVKFAVGVNSGGATHILQSQMCTFQCFSSIEIHLKNQMLERERGRVLQGRNEEVSFVIMTSHTLEGSSPRVATSIGEKERHIWFLLYKFHPHLVVHSNKTHIPVNSTDLLDR